MNLEQIDPKKMAGWARGKSAGEWYIYHSSQDCALAQYLRSEGVSVKWVHGYTFLTSEGQFDIPECMVYPLSDGPETFGALADRLEAIRGDE